jgi:hypothetical protein
LRPALDAFAQVRPELVPRGSKSSLYAAMRDLIDETGEGPAVEFIPWADRTMRDKNLDVKSPRSYLWLVGRWRTKTPQDPTKDEWGLCVGCHISPCECEGGDDG